MTEEKTIDSSSVNEYRRLMGLMGRREFILSKMIEYGIWPKDLPTPYERQVNETKEEYLERKKLKERSDEIVRLITELYKDKKQINQKIKELGKEYDESWNIEKIRKEIARILWDESKQKRLERKKQRELEKQQRSEAWRKKKIEMIVFVGKGYSSMIAKFETNEDKLKSFALPIIQSDRDLAKLLEIEYKKLRFLSYHRDVVETDHYVRYEIPKKRGGTRRIAAPKALLKQSQRQILDTILSKIPASNHAHGFLKGKSVVTGANIHSKKPGLVINMDLEDFFPTITFERIRGMFIAIGYSGHISTILAMLCTYCERMPIEVKGKVKYVAITRRILPQGSPASPMITNIICRRLDKRLSGLTKKFGLTYSRYADDISFSILDEKEVNVKRFCGLVSKIIKEEGFKINKEKTRFLRKNNRQAITGIVINNKEIGIPRPWIRKFRAAIYNAEKLKKNDKLPTEVIPELSGMASWVKSVNPVRYKNYINAVLELIKK